MFDMQAAFDVAYASIVDGVEFDPRWSEPTGSMHRAAWATFARPSKFIDDRGRRCIALPLAVSLDGRHHALVIYEHKFFQNDCFGSNGLDTAAFPGTMSLPSMLILLDLVKDGVLGPSGERAMKEIASAQPGNEAYFLRQMRGQFLRLGWLPTAA